MSTTQIRNVDTYLTNFSPRLKSFSAALCLIAISWAFGAPAFMMDLAAILVLPDSPAKIKSKPLVLIAKGNCTKSVIRLRELSTQNSCEICEKIETPHSEAEPHKYSSGTRICPLGEVSRWKGSPIFPRSLILQFPSGPDPSPPQENQTTVPRTDLSASASIALKLAVDHGFVAPDHVGDSFLFLLHLMFMCVQPNLERIAEAVSRDQALLQQAEIFLEVRFQCGINDLTFLSAGERLGDPSGRNICFSRPSFRFYNYSCQCTSSLSGCGSERVSTKGTI